MKRVLAVVGLLLVVVFVVLHLQRLDVLLWQSWKLNRQSMPEQAFNLGRYRVDIEARVVEGIDDDLSALTFNEETGTLFGVLNGKPLLVELSLEGELLRQVHVEGVIDMEGLTHVGGNRYVIAEERSQRLLLVEVPPDAERIDTAGAASLTIGLDRNGNKGLEGLSWDHKGERLLVAKERDPIRLLEVEGFVDALPGAPLNIRINELKQAESPRLFMKDLSSLSLHEETGHLLLLSDESRMVVEYSADGKPLSLLGLWRGMGGLKASVPQAEGLALDKQKRLYLVSEPNLFYRFVPEN